MQTTLRLSVSTPVPAAALHVTCRSRAMAHRRVVLARAEQRQESASPSESETPSPSSGGGDFWEGDRWDGIGKVMYFMVPVLVLAGIGVGFFAASTYNDGATVFIAAPTSPDDTVSFFSVAD